MKDFFEVISSSWLLVSNPGKRQLVSQMLVLFIIALIDALAVFLLAISLGYSAGESIEQNLLWIVTVILLFLIKSIATSIFHSRANLSLAKQEVRIGDKAMDYLGSLSWSLRGSIKRGEYIKLIETAPTAITQGVLSNFVQLVPELVSIIGILTVLFFVKPMVALVSVIFFLSVALVQQKIVSKRMGAAASALNSEISRVHTLLLDGRELGKVLSVFSSKSYDGTLAATRARLATTRARVTFFGFVPGYLMDATVAVGFLVIGAVSLAIEGAAGVFASLTVFGASGLRLLPAINRVQMNTLRVLSQKSLISEFLSKLTNISGTGDLRPSEMASFSDPKIALKLENVSFEHSSSSKLTINDVSVVFEFGKKYAIVGPSGAGKTSLVDLILGLHTKYQGKIEKNIRLISSYVPQDTYLFSGNLIQNIALEWNLEKIDKKLVDEMISVMELAASPMSVEDANVQDSLSGGQKQRVGIARALYKKSNFIVFDEATSSLDVNLESKLIKIIESYSSEAALIFVAHRLSTIKNADTILYLEGGRITGQGNFEALAASHAGFAAMVKNSKL